MSRPTHANLYQRYLWLVELIYRRKFISKRDIRKAWANNFFLNHAGKKFPDRTFIAHREAIEDLFNIKVVCEKHAPYRYYIENHENITFNELQKWLIESFSVNQLIHENKALKDRILLEEIPLHHSQKEIEITNTYSVFSYHLNPNYELIQELLSHGPNIEVIAPNALRDKISEFIASMHNIYSTKKMHQRSF